MEQTFTISHLKNKKLNIMTKIECVNADIASILQRRNELKQAVESIGSNQFNQYPQNLKQGANRRPSRKENTYSLDQLAAEVPKTDANVHPKNQSLIGEPNQNKVTELLQTFASDSSQDYLA